MSPIANRASLGLLPQLAKPLHVRTAAARVVGVRAFNKSHGRRNDGYEKHRVEVSLACHRDDMNLLLPQHSPWFAFLDYSCRDGIHQGDEPAAS